MDKIEHIDHEDSIWDKITYLTKSSHKKNSNKEKESLLNNQRNGNTISVKKIHYGSSIQKKLDEHTGEGANIEKVDNELKQLIVKARNAKKLSQKQLANSINEKQSLIAQYENGSAIPNPAILLKLEKKLGVKLTGRKKKYK